MKEFVRSLDREIRQKTDRIERTDRPAIEKAIGASKITAEATDRLKGFVTGYRFKDEGEEIEFFKEIKPRICAQLIYRRKICNIQMRRPTDTTDGQRRYLCSELRKINDFNDERVDFVRYYRSGATHLDRHYFIRGEADIMQYMEECSHEFDPTTSTNADYAVARILANDMAAAYLLTDIERLETQPRPSIPHQFPETRLTWQDSKTDLIELIYGLDSKGSFGNVSLTQLANYLFNVFNVSPDCNISRTFGDMKIRNRPTSFLDEVKEKLLQRMQRWRINKKNDK